MSLVDVDSWLTEYEACERLSHTILAQLSQRDNRQRLSPEYNRLTSSIQIGLGQFDTELRQLKLKLDGATKGESLTSGEIDRRQRQFDTLQSKLQQLQSKFNNSTRSDRSALLNETAGQSPWSSTATKSEAAPIIDATDVNLMKQRQIDILEDQNRGLEALSQTISRQRALASQLGQEVEDQNDILDNLANTMERVDMRVNMETQNIGQLNRRDSTFGYWIIILLLFLAIVIVAVV